MPLVSNFASQNHYLANIVLSPAGLFMVFCMFTPPILEFILPMDKPLSTSIDYWLAPPVCLWLSIGIIAVVYTHSDKKAVKELSKVDTWVASWYLINGCFFNSLMDVFAGFFQSWPTMTQRYNELEPRYTMVGTYDGVTVQLTSWQELLIQTPCGLALYYAYHRDSSWRLPVEIIFNMWSACGVWYFYGSEYILGFPHIHFPRGDDGTWDMSVASCYKFWLGFVIFPLLWFVVGVLMTIRASTQIMLLTKVTKKNK